MKAILREPLLQFFALGALISVLFAVFDDSPAPVSTDTIIVSQDDVQRLAEGFTATWRRPPTQSELDHLIDAFVREEVYVREALAIGLDRDDPVIRRRLQMKMEILTESGAAAIAPDDVTLKAHLAANTERFMQPPRVAFEQVMLDDGVGRETVKTIQARLEAGGEPDGVRPSLLPTVLPASPPQVIDGVFGSGFFDAVSALPVGAWAGPVTSSLGVHLVRVTEGHKARLPLLSEIRDRVESDWRAGQIALLREERFETLASRYKIVRPDPEALIGR